MLRKQDYNTYTFVAANIASSGLSAGTEVKPSNIAEGEVILTDLGNRVLAAYPATGAVRIVQGMGATKPLKIVDIADVEAAKVTWQKFIPGAEQVVIIGYDPATATGTLSSANDTSYYVRIKKLDLDAANRSQQVTGITGQFKTSNAASQQEVALGLVDQLFKNTLFEAINAGKPEYVKISAVSDATIGTAVNTGDVTFGSKLVPVTAGPVPVAGQEIQILGDTYTVESVGTTPNLITLTSPYRGEDATGVAIDDAYSSPATNYGIKIEGVRNPFDVASFRDYYRNRFQVIFSDNSTPEKITSNSFEGVGEYEEVAMNEYLSWGFVGQNHMIAVPPKAREAITKVLAEYGTLQIRWADQEKDLLTTGNFKGSVLIYPELDSSGATAVLSAANAGGVLLAQFIANTALAAAGLTATSLDE